MPSDTDVQIPRVGMLATVRNRRGIVAGVEPYSGDSGQLHLVHIDYIDDNIPHEERLIWEIEACSSLLEPTALPDVSGSDPMPGADYDAVLRAARWMATTPYIDPDGEGPVERLPVSSPFHGAVQIEDYQLVPLLKALRMPRVNLLLADDVGLGKTIEAGLILTELLLRRRIQRVLILTPASLRLQWQDEMWDKFSLSFDLVDRHSTQELRKRLGMDANPWRSFGRIIASYHYLRQEDIREQFLAASTVHENSPHLPWDLLIVDECHNLMPSPFGESSDLCNMLRIIAPYFEHRLFLSATPHNGHTQSFSGLLEMLDPVRFSQKSDFSPAEKARIPQIVLRRLKRDINARSESPRFSNRAAPRAIPLDLSEQELAVNRAFNSFRLGVRRAVAEERGSTRRSGSFAVEILGKRLLSCPVAFAESWRRSREGMSTEESATDADVASAARGIRRETDDDREAQKRAETAAGVVGAWLRRYAEGLQDQIGDIDTAVAGLRLDTAQEDMSQQDPRQDTRFDALCSLISELLMDGEAWLDDERLVVFTEYKTTLDYLARRLRTMFDEERILTLYGGMDEKERDLIKQAFNDPEENVRILVATDAASEGLNLQRTARYVLHYDCPWNPSKLEQRNGRLDRHGQARTVTVHHFISDQDDDLRFLSHVIHKADSIREDLGTVNELFDEAAHRRLVDGEDLATVRRDLDLRLDTARGRSRIEADETVTQDLGGGELAQDVDAIAAEVDLCPENIRDTLEAAMAFGRGRPQLSCNDEKTICTIEHPSLPGWTDVIDETLRRPVRGGVIGPLCKIAFGIDPFLEDIGARKIFRPKTDIKMMHLSHPMISKAFDTLSRCRYPGTDGSASRWTVRLGGVPEGADAAIFLNIEELAVNELRETFHRWIRSVVFPVRSGALAPPLPHEPAIAFNNGRETRDPSHFDIAREIVNDVEVQLKEFIEEHANALTLELRKQVEIDGAQAIRDAQEQYRSRQGEISNLIAENTMAKLGRELEQLKAERRQGYLLDDKERLDRLDRSIEEKEAEIQRRKQHYEEIRLQLEKERERVIRYLLPRRYEMAGEAQVFPVSIEVRLPGDDA